MGSDSIRSGGASIDDSPRPSSHARLRWMSRAPRKVGMSLMEAWRQGTTVPPDAHDYLREHYDVHAVEVRHVGGTVEGQPWDLLLLRGERSPGDSAIMTVLDARQWHDAMERICGHPDVECSRDASPEAD